MFLKKINQNLSKALEENGLLEANELQKESFGTIKSGVDCVLSSPEKGGKTTTIVINVIQRLEKAFEESPRALIIVKDKAKVLEIQEVFSKFAYYTDLRVYGVYEQGDIDYDKNQISLGIDVLVGTAGRLNDMFASAGFDVNRLKMFIVDDIDDLLKMRLEPKIVRLSDSISKTQRLFFGEQITERVELLADRLMIEPLFFEAEQDEE